MFQFGLGPPHRMGSPESRQDGRTGECLLWMTLGPRLIRQVPQGLVFVYNPSNGSPPPLSLFFPSLPISSPTTVFPTSPSESSTPSFPDHPPPMAMPDQMKSDLNTLRCSYEAARWRSGREPIIGSPDCDALAERYGDRGRSCYVVFVYQKAAGPYGCRHDGCFRDGDDKGPSFQSITEAIKHQRSYHF